MKQVDSEVLDEMIERSRELIDRNWKDGSEEGPFLKYVGKNQIRNILDMAQATDSFKVLETFILYQAGRRMISQKFANELTKELEIVRKTHGIERIREYLGYMYRYFVWKNSQDGDGIND